MSKYIKLTAVVGSLKYLKIGGRLSGAAFFPLVFPITTTFPSSILTTGVI